MNEEILLGDILDWLYRQSPDGVREWIYDRWPSGEDLFEQCECDGHS